MNAELSVAQHSGSTRDVSASIVPVSYNIHTTIDLQHNNSIGLTRYSLLKKGHPPLGYLDPLLADGSQVYLNVPTITNLQLVKVEVGRQAWVIKYIM